MVRKNLQRIGGIRASPKASRRLHFWTLYRPWWTAVLKSTLVSASTRAVRAATRQVTRIARYQRRTVVRASANRAWPLPPVTTLQASPGCPVIPGSGASLSSQWFSLSFSSSTFFSTLARCRPASQRIQAEVVGVGAVEPKAVVGVVEKVSTKRESVLRSETHQTLAKLKVLLLHGPVAVDRRRCPLVARHPLPHLPHLVRHRVEAKRRLVLRSPSFARPVFRLAWQHLV